MFLIRQHAAPRMRIRRLQGAAAANLGAVAAGSGAVPLQEAVLDDPGDALARLLHPPGASLA